MENLKRTSEIKEGISPQSFNQEDNFIKAASKNEIKTTTIHVKIEAGKPLR